jgi:hypothetical protein
MEKLGLVLMVFSFVCFVLSIWVPTHWNKLIGAGLAFFTAALIFGNVGLLFKGG